VVCLVLELEREAVLLPPSGEQLDEAIT